MTQTQGEEIERLDELAATYRSRLRVLGRQIAAYGIAVPAHVVLDQEQAERDLARTLAELRRLRPAPLPPSSQMWLRPPAKPPRRFPALRR